MIDRFVFLHDKNIQSEIQDWKNLNTVRYQEI